MILQPQHQHDDVPEEPKKEINKPNTTKTIEKKTNQIPVPSTHQKDNSGPPPIFAQMLDNSLKLISSKGAKEVREKMTYFEEKVHLGFSEGPANYLSHLSNKLLPQHKDTLEELINIQNWLAADRIYSGKVSLSLKTEIPTLKGQITSKLLDMKQSMMSLSSIDKKAQSYIQHLLQFKKKNYWMHQSQSKVKVKRFLTKMKRIQSQQKKRYENSMLIQEEQLRMSLEKDRMEKEEARKRIHSKELERHLNWKRERERNSEEGQKKKEQVEAMLAKLNQGTRPKYKIMEERFRKNYLEPLEEEREKRLEEIKAEHQPIDPQQLEEHLQRYQEYKESLMEEQRKKDEEWQEMTSKLQQDLKDLYHGKHHKGIEPRFYNSVKEGKINARKKVKEYERQVSEKFKPSIDPLKKSKLEEHIFDLKVKEEKNKRKVVLEDGSIVLEPKPQFNARRIGVQYLEQLKQESEGKPRKERTSSLLDLPVSTKPKRIDYLRENKPKLNLKKTIGEWKKVVGDNSYSARQKYESIMEQAAVMEEKAKQKQAQMRSYKKGEKALEYSAQMDKYYTESVSAKMVVLKDVILKQ